MCMIFTSQGSLQGRLSGDLAPYSVWKPDWLIVSCRSKGDVRGGSATTTGGGSSRTNTHTGSSAGGNGGLAAQVVVIDEDPAGDGMVSAGAAFLARILQYQETPQYLRKCAAARHSPTPVRTLCRSLSKLDMLSHGLQSEAGRDAQYRCTCDTQARGFGATPVILPGNIGVSAAVPARPSGELLALETVALRLGVSTPTTMLLQLSAANKGTRLAQALP